MRERAEAIGGELAVESRPGKGTCIRVTVPLPGDPRPTNALSDLGG